MKALILAILVALAPFYGDKETPERRLVRLESAAEAMAAAAEKYRDRIPPLMTAAALITLGKHESNFAQFVGEGRCLDGPKGMRCDQDPSTGEPRARSYYQLWKVACPKLWETEPGSREEQMVAADCAIVNWAKGWHACGPKHPDGRIAGAFAGYRTQSNCKWAPAKKRASTMAHFQSKLNAEKRRRERELAQAELHEHSPRLAVGNAASDQ